MTAKTDIELYMQYLIEQSNGEPVGYERRHYCEQCEDDFYNCISQVEETDFNE